MSNAIYKKLKNYCDLINTTRYNVPYFEFATETLMITYAI